MQIFFIIANQPYSGTKSPLRDQLPHRFPRHRRLPRWTLGGIILHIILLNMTLCFESPRLWHKYAHKYLRRWPVGTFLANPTKLKILKIKVMPFSATYEGMERAWIFGEVI